MANQTNDAVETAETMPTDAPVKKRRGGRKPYTPEQKEAAKKMREEQKKKAESMIPDVYVQYQGWDKNVSEMIEEARAAFRQEKKRSRITDMKLYVKPDERTVYYVINGDHEGKIEY